MSESLRISELKELKQVALEYFWREFPDHRTKVFYSEGTVYNDFSDQYLKVETAIPETEGEIRQRVHQSILAEKDIWTTLPLRIKKI